MTTPLPNENTHPEGQLLLDAIHTHLDELEKLLTYVNSHWHAEDKFYRFYYGSFKVYGLQEDTKQIVELLRSLQSDRELNTDFTDIITEGIEKEWVIEHNKQWAKETRPILEAFFHARMMLELAVKYGKELETAPNMLPSGWAALLCLYGIR
jgi:hypothetical protein